MISGPGGPAKFVTNNKYPLLYQASSFVSIRPILDYLIHFSMPNFGSHSRSRAQGLSSDSITLTDSDNDQEGKDLRAIGGSIEVSASFFEFWPGPIMNKYLRRVSSKHKQECRI